MPLVKFHSLATQAANCLYKSVPKLGQFWQLSSCIVGVTGKGSDIKLYPLVYFPQHTMADLGTSRHGRKRTASHRLSEGKTSPRKGKRSKAGSSTAPPQASVEPSPANSQPEPTAAAPAPPRPDTTPVPSDLNAMIQEAIKHQLQSAGLLPNTAQSSQPPVPDPSTVSQPQLPAPPQPPAWTPSPANQLAQSPSPISHHHLPAALQLPGRARRRLTTRHRFPAAPSRTVSSTRRIRSAPCLVCPAITVSPCAARWILIFHPKSKQKSGKGSQSIWHISFQLVMMTPSTKCFRSMKMANSAGYLCQKTGSIP